MSGNTKTLNRRQESNARMDESLSLRARHVLDGGKIRPNCRFTHDRNKDASLRFLQERRKRRQSKSFGEGMSEFFGKIMARYSAKWKKKPKPVLPAVLPDYEVEGEK